MYSFFMHIQRKEKKKKAEKEAFFFFLTSWLSMNYLLCTSVFPHCKEEMQGGFNDW